MAGAALVVALALVATIVTLPGQNPGIAYALDRLDLTAAATSGQVDASQTLTEGDRNLSSSTRFVFDGDDAALTRLDAGDGVARASYVVDGIGYKNYVASDQVGNFTASPLFDRKRLFGKFDNNLATVADLRALIENGRDVTRTDMGNGTEVLTMSVDVGAGSGEEFDFATYDGLPTSALLAPFGDLTIDLTVTVIGDYIDEIAYTVNGTRPALENPEETEAVVAAGSLKFAGINEPREIAPPAEATPAAGIDEWVLLSGDEWAAHDNFRRADTLYPDTCVDFDRNWETLLGSLSGADKDNFEGLADCFVGIEERGIAQSIRALVNLHN